MIMTYDPSNTFGHAAYPSTYEPASPKSPTLDSSPSTISSSTCLTTPPSSLRQYSSALKAMMAQGMSAAVADLNDDTREAERSFDKEFGYDDEDPIERHMRMSLTPSRVKMPIVDRGSMSYTAFMDLMRLKEEQENGVRVEEVPAPAPAQEAEVVMDLPDGFRPGLIQFHRTHSSARRGIPSFTSSAESSRSGSSTPFGEGTDTPGSEWSEASFEAIKPEDVMSLYGKPVPGMTAPGFPFPASPSSDDTFGVPRTDRFSTVSTSSTITHFSTPTELDTPRHARPGLGRPKPRTNPYAGSYEGRQKERDTG